MTVGVVRRDVGNLRGFGTRRCSTCELEVIDPLPTQERLESLYAESYRLHRDEPIAARSPVAQSIDRLKRVMLWMHDHRHGPAVTPRPPGRVLDVGFGSGTRLIQLSEQGWQVSGLEVAEGPVVRLRSILPEGRFLVGSIETTTFPADGFDRILLYHVLEHLDDPTRALRDIATWLSEGGSIVVAVPNRGSLIRRLFGTYWYGYEHPEHLVQYSRRALEALARDAGLTVWHVRPQPYYHAIGDSMGNVLDPTRDRARLRRIVKALSLPIGLASVFVHDAAALEVEMRRP